MKTRKPKRIVTTGDFIVWCNSKEMSIRTANGLNNMLPCKANGAVAEPFAKWLAAHPPSEMLKVRNFGRKSLSEFADLVKRHAKDHPGFPAWVALFRKRPDMPKHKMSKGEMLKMQAQQMVTRSESRQRRHLEELSQRVTAGSYEVMRLAQNMERLWDDLRALGTIVHCLDIRTKHFNPPPQPLAGHQPQP